ncbi:tetratricopeptide repeat protein [Methanobacterium alcaliphilum]|nr:tetratricopeptide repeat protein [Methanobacterium alcaliphilum]MCK9151820.1 tetratricopeptide repeat protein [Methanobacterium alcaliphilum]
MCDRTDIGGFSTPYHPHTREATIFIYDAHSGGIGLAEKAMDLFEEILKVTLQMVKSCGCKAGCPSCIYFPKCGNDNQPLDKNGTEYILQKMLKLINSDFENIISKEIPSKNPDTTNNFPRANVGAEALKEFDSCKLLNEKGMGHFNEGKLEEALHYFDQSLLSIENVEALKHKGMIMELKENRMEAIKYYDKALKLDPHNGRIMYLKAVSLFNNNDLVDAVNYLQKIVEIKADNDDAWYLLGLAMEYQGDTAQAVKCYCKSLSINPRHGEAVENLRNLI